jgi:hypothetical protein
MEQQMSTTKQIYDPLLAWWAGQKKIPARAPLWVATAAVVTALLLLPRLFGSSAEMATTVLLFSVPVVGFFWIKHLRPGRLSTLWKAALLGSLILILVVGVGQILSTLASSNNFMGNIVFLIIAGALILVPMFIGIGAVVYYFARKKAIRPANGVILNASTTAASTTLADIPAELAVLYDNARLGKHFFDSGLAQKLGETGRERMIRESNKRSSKQNNKYSTIDLAIDSYALSQRFARSRSNAGEYVDGDLKYRVPRLLRTETSRAGLTAWFDLLPGTTAANYAKAAGVLEIALGLPFGISVSQTAEDTRDLQIRFEFKLTNPLAEVVPYTVDIGTQITPDTPWIIGPDLDNNPVTYDIAKNAHLLIAGATRSGKSVCTYSLIVHVLRMGDSAQLLIADPNDTTMAPFEHLVSWATNSIHPEQPTEMLQWVRGEMERRRPILRQMRRDKIEVFTPELPMIVVIVDEAANYMRHADKNAAAAFIDELMAVVAQGAKFGVRLVLITQRPDATILPTSVRSQLSARISFRLEDTQTATMVFPDLDNPAVLLEFDTGVGMYKEVGGQPRQFRSVYLQDHWAAADQITHPLPKVDIHAIASASEPLGQIDEIDELFDK